MESWKRYSDAFVDTILELRAFPNVQFYTKCAVLVPICAVLILVTI